MALMGEVPQADYWHVRLEGSRKDVAEALKIFPSPVVTHNKGLFSKDIRAYHSGGAVMLDGKRVGSDCLECQFPTNLPVVSHYSPIFSVGFTFSRKFSLHAVAQKFMQKTDNSNLEIFELRRQILHYGRRYTADRPDAYTVKGLIASTDVKRMIDFYEELKNEGSSSIGELRYSPYPKFDLGHSVDSDRSGIL